MFLRGKLLHGRNTKGKILKEKYTNINGLAWIRTHGVDHEGTALCSIEVNEEIENIEVGIGQITCPNCIEVVKVCHSISPNDFAPEYENQLHSMTWSNGLEQSS